MNRLIQRPQATRKCFRETIRKTPVKTPIPPDLHDIGADIGVRVSCVLGVEKAFGLDFMK